MLSLLPSPLINTAHAAIQFESSIGLSISKCGLTPDGYFLACYIQSLYSFFLQAAIVLAVLMIMLGGFQWMIAVGDAGKIKNAKDVIISALTGLVLAFISFLILAQINESLVNLKSINITKVEISADLSNQSVPEGFCRRTGEQPKLYRIHNKLKSQEELKTFHYNLVTAMDNLEGILAKRGEKTAEQRSQVDILLSGVDLISISDSRIFHVSGDNQACSRKTAGDNASGSCIHRTAYFTGDKRFWLNDGSSLHYGPTSRCAFNLNYPPVSCAVDLKDPISGIFVTADQKKLFYSSLGDDMIAAGFGKVQCEDEEENVVNCIFADHIHGELSKLPSSNLGCTDVMRPVIGTPAAE